MISIICTVPSIHYHVTNCHEYPPSSELRYAGIPVFIGFYTVGVSAPPCRVVSFISNDIYIITHVCKYVHFFQKTLHFSQFCSKLYAIKLHCKNQHIRKTADAGLPPRFCNVIIYSIRRIFHPESRSDLFQSVYQMLPSLHQCAMHNPCAGTIHLSATR